MSLKVMPRPADPPPASQPDPGVNVFAVYGVEPEVQAYAMAKYSRSALSMRESLKEINDQKAEKFLNTFYFQYGHRSIADLAHLAFAIERLSILAAIVLVDEQRWDGQERSTRYQDFRKSGYFVPDFGADGDALHLYRETADFLFAEYDALSDAMFRYLVSQTPRPDDMKQDAYERTLKARAFDISRYLLPLATNTSLGQIVNARTLETQVARLLSNGYPEVRRLGELLKQAAREPAFNANAEAARGLIEELRRLEPDLAARAEQQLLKEVRVAPTLVKYAEANAYEMETRKELAQLAWELTRDTASSASRAPVDLLEDEPLEVELPATLLYAHSALPYRAIREKVSALPARRREEIVALGTKHRGKHDELMRHFAAGQKFRFDITMDIGGFRDMHRHRRCIQILQPYSDLGYEIPDEVNAAGRADQYSSVMDRVLKARHKLIDRLQAHPQREIAHASTLLSDYLRPLGNRMRALFKMDFAEVVYISELRTTPAGHASYRRVAYAMYEEVARRHPSLASFFRVHDIHAPVDLLKR